MTDANPYYKLIDGEPMISPAGLALLLDLPQETVLAEYERQAQGAASGVMQMPAAWRKRGVRVRKETQAALGYEAGMKECLDYLASRA